MLFFLALSFSPGRAWADRVSAKIGDLTVGADNMFLDQEKDFASLRGNVQIIHKGQFLEADEVDIHRATRKAYMRGNVTIQDATTRIEGERIDFDYESSTGIIYNGIVRSGNVSFAGDILHKTKDQEYYVMNADYTTCTNCPPSWSFSGNSIRATMGGYAYIKNSVLRFGGIPFFWLPYLVVPLKSDRQSGLLAPSFEKSNSSGLIYSQGFFWAISRSQDATIQLTNYELRGLKTGLNYRYVLDQNSSGELDAAYINDRVFSNESRFNRFRSTEQTNRPFSRWFTKYDHLYELPENYYFRTQINQASDLQYSKDFATETKNLGDSAMENRVSVTNNYKDRHWSIDSSYYVNMLQSNPTAGNDNAVHRLPEIRYSKTQQQLLDTSLYYSIDMNYVNFARPGLGYDNLSTNSEGKRYISNNYSTINNSPTPDGFLKCEQFKDCQQNYDGTYDPNTDLIRTGQRLDIRPSIYRPFTVNEYLDISPKATYRETHYYFNVGENAQNVRRSLLLDLGVSSTLSRIYRGDTEQSDTYKHEIQPTVNYRRIPWIDHRSHPFFGFSQQTEAPYFTRDSISDADIDGDGGLQFDYNDRIYDRNLMTYGFTNRLIQKRWRNGQASTRQVASLGIFQSYDAYQDSRNEPNKQPWSDIVTTLDVQFDHVQSTSTFNYFPYQKVTNYSSRLRLIDELGKFIQLGFVRRLQIVPGKDIDYNNRTEDYTFAAGFLSKHVNLMGRVIYDANWENKKDQRQLKAWGYVTQFKPPGDCMAVNFYHYQTTDGDVKFKMDFNFSFDGKPQSPLPPETLDTL